MRQLIALVAATTALCVPAAWASPSAVVRDCASDGSLDGSYSDADKRAAIGQLGAELQEYSDCRSVIAASIGGGPNASGSSSSDGDDGTAAAADRANARNAADRAKKKKKARERRTTQVALNDDALRPDRPATLDAEETSNGISTPVLLALIALALLGAAGLLFALGRRNARVADAFRRVSFARFRR